MLIDGVMLLWFLLTAFVALISAARPSAPAGSGHGRDLLRRARSRPAPSRSLSAAATDAQALLPISRRDKSATRDISHHHAVVEVEHDPKRAANHKDDQHGGERHSDKVFPRRGAEADMEEEAQMD